jgi:hypothetical protein
MSVELRDREPEKLERAFEEVERSLLAFEGPSTRQCRRTS